MKFRWVSIWMIFLAFSCWAQAQPASEDRGNAESAAAEADEIETDRDSFTPAMTTVGRGRVVVETAYTFIDNREVYETHSLPELLIRAGIAERLELRFGSNYEVGGAGNPVSANTPDDLADRSELEEATNVSYGLKYLAWEGEGAIPQTGILLNGFTPTSGEVTDTHMSGTIFTGWTWPKGWSWDSALRFSTGSLEEDRFHIWAPSTVVKIPVGDRWKVHAEYFGIFSDGREHESVQHFFSPGAHYLITPDWEMGARVGWGLNDQAPNFFVNVGGGYRF